MKRLNFTILTVFILVISLSISTVNCSASEPYFTDLIEAGLGTQEAIDMYNYYLNADVVKPYLSDINSYKYVIAVCRIYSSNTYMYFYCFNDDVVMYEYSIEDSAVLGIVSKSEKIPCKVFYFYTNNSVLNPDGSIKVVLNNISDREYTDKITKNDIVYHRSPYYYGVDAVGNFVRCDVPIYQDLDNACLALEGNDIKPLYGNTISYSQDNAEKLYFKSFNVIPHVGTNLNTSYFVINYELSDYAESNIDNLSLYISHQYFFNFQQPAFEKYHVGKKYGRAFDLTKAKGTFTLYCNQLQGLVDFKKELWFSDDNIVGKANTVEITQPFANALILLNTGVKFDVGDIWYIDASTIQFICQIRGFENGKYISGQWKSFTYDFLSHKSNTAGVVPDKDNWLSNENPTYTVDADGEQTHNSYFYEDTVTNSDNSTATKYYYTDGDKTTEITYNQYTNNEVPDGMSNPWVVDASAEGGNASATGGSAVANASVGDINININNGSSEYISISPVDYNQFIKAFEDVLKTFDVKGGLFQLLQGVFSMFPERVNVYAVGAIGATVIVSAICILRRR